MLRFWGITGPKSAQCTLKWAAAVSRGIPRIWRGEPRNLANAAAEFGKICRGKLWALLIVTCWLTACTPDQLQAQCSVTSMGSLYLFRSTRPSRPNKAGLKCPSVRPQKVFSILMKFGMYVQVDDWCMTVCSMTRSKVKVMSPWKSKIRPFLNAISSHIYNGGWQMNTDS